MKVKAKFSQGKFGFAGGRRRYDGDEFDIEPSQFSRTWMVKIEQPKRTRKPQEEQIAATEDGAE